MPDKKPKVLMIEEDRFLRKIYRDKLSRLGFEFLEATNGEEGLNKIIYEKPDLIILDLMLPKKNGFDVLIDIKNNKNTQKIPVIIFSNLGQESDVKKGFALGAASYLVKTDVSLSGVVEEVKEQIAKNR